MLHLLIALQIAAAGHSHAVPLSGADSIAVVARLRAETADFVWVWRFYWEASEALRHELQGELFPASRPRMNRPLSNRVARDRVNHVHCHPDNRGGFPVLPTIIREGGGSLRAICPRWSMPESPLHDERLSIDDALTDWLRSGTRIARAELIASLEQASADLPGDEWLIGQRVRFAIDQADTAATVRAIRDCRASEWWCAVLGGYVRYTDDDAAGADSLFMVALAKMPAGERCRWTDVSLLLDEAARKQYEAVPCERRDTVEARFWWLADPLYSEPGNERRAEHFSRLVMIELHRDGPPTDRWNWTEGEGGRSLREMLVRYGWPAHAWWSGPLEDRSHYSYLRVFDERIQAAGTFTTAEYSTPRFHTIPNWSAIVDPWHATSGAWDIAATRDDHGRPDLGWWPEEHFGRRAGALAPIAEYQSGMFRRGKEIEFAVAADIPTTTFSRPGIGGVRPVGEGSVALAITPSPADLRVIRSDAPLDSGRVMARTLMAAQPTIVGLEVRPLAGGVAARTRFGVTPPPTLEAMGRNEIAISDPVLVRPAPSGERPASDPRTAVNAMLGTTVLRDMDRVGVYWETYGIAAGDSVDVSVRIDRIGSPGIFRRLGTALGVADRVDGSATIRWKEPQAIAATTTVDGMVPIQGRNVTIDLSRLVPDRYSVTVSVSRAGGQLVSSTREFQLARR